MCYKCRVNYASASRGQYLDQNISWTISPIYRKRFIVCVVEWFILNVIMLVTTQFISQPRPSTFLAKRRTAKRAHTMVLYPPIMDGQW
jgi:hypothetical protein